MVIRDNFSFILVPQRDRRQHPDRRAVWRGTRRAADRADAHVGAADGTESMPWTPMLEDPGPAFEKRMLH